MMETRRISRRRIITGMCVAALALACDHGTAPSAAAPLAATIAFESAEAIVGVRATLKLTATIRDAQGNDITALAAVQWTTSDASLATVDDTGAVTGVRLGGPVTITATTNGHSASVAFRVTPARIEITPNVSVLPVSATAQLSATAMDFFGAPLDAGPITWESDAPGVATVDQTGFLTAVGAGNAGIRASAAGRTSLIGVLVGVPTPYDGTFYATTPPSIVTVTVRFGVVIHFTGNFNPLTGCSISVSADLYAPIDALGRINAVLPGTNVGGIQTSIIATFGSATSVQGAVFGGAPQGCQQGAVTPSAMSFGNFVATR